MSLSVNKLPAEVLLIVFSHVEDTRKLTQCRLVCKTWNPLAERVLISRKIYISRNITATKLCQYLTMKPQIARYINYIHLHDRSIPNTLMNELLLLAITPNIIELEGNISNSAFEFLLDMARSEPQIFEKLQKLPNPITLNFTYIEALLQFRKSLRELDIKPIQASAHELVPLIFNRLGEFENLNKLCLKFSEGIGNLLGLEQMLRKCHHLHTLEIELLSNRGGYQLSKAELKAWLVQNVHKYHSVSTLNIGKVVYPHTIEYLFYKYPKISTAFIGPFLETASGISDRIIHAVKDIGTIHLSRWAMRNANELKHFISKTKRKTNRVRIYQDDYTEANLDYEVDIIRDSKCSHFTIKTQLGSVISAASLEDILSSIDGLISLEIDYVCSKHWKYNKVDQTELTPFYSLLKLIPDIENLTYTDAYIKYEPLLPQNLVVGKLANLTICGAVIDERIFPILDTIAPNLKVLALDSCILDFVSYRNYHIRMSNADLDYVSIVSNASVSHSFGNNQSKCRLQRLQVATRLGSYQMVSVQIAMLSSNQVLYYALKNSKASDIQRITRDDYIRDTTGWPSIIIECSSLHTLAINLGLVDVKIKLDTPTPIQEIGDWRLDSQHDIIRRLYQSE